MSDGRSRDAVGHTARALSLEHLNVTFASPDGDVRAVRDLSLSIAPGECLGVVGESGAGKSQAFLAILGLLVANGRTSGEAHFGSVDLLSLPQTELDRIRGARIGMVFQDPMTSLNPTMSVSKQISETLRYHDGITGEAARKRAIELLDAVQIPSAAARVDQYPFQFSGGMRQRVMIAMAIACNPSVLIADEPTGELDSVSEEAVLRLLTDVADRGAAVVVASHSAAVAAAADRVIRLSDGRVEGRFGGAVA